MGGSPSLSLIPIPAAQVVHPLRQQGGPGCAWAWMGCCLLIDSGTFSLSARGLSKTANPAACAVKGRSALLHELFGPSCKGWEWRAGDGGISKGEQHQVQLPARAQACSLSASFTRSAPRSVGSPAASSSVCPPAQEKVTASFFYSHHRGFRTLVSTRPSVDPCTKQVSAALGETRKGGTESITGSSPIAQTSSRLMPLPHRHLQPRTSVPRIIKCPPMHGNSACW